MENGVILAVEEAVQGLEGIDEIRSTAREGSASVTIEALEGVDLNQLWQEVKGEVDRINTFPEEAKEPKVSIASRKRSVLTLALFGKASEIALRETAENVRDELLSNPIITQVELSGVRDYEVHIEISQAALRRYGLTLQQVAQIVGRASVERGGGSLRTKGGEILVRMQDRKDYAREFANLPVFTGKDGSRVLLGDVAEVSEGFEDNPILGLF